ncbi:MAG: porphobilinogen synthase [Spirochaetaceae bacterium]|jgi:porphobilinogen synthase|nr:porphobilinogen synthase [Spirochaetaceae bacterium]
MFPTVRMRRMRGNENLRRLIRETKLSVDDMIMPLFVCPGEGVRKEIGSMPGNYHFSIDELVKECLEIRSLKIPGVILFGIPEAKDAAGSDTWSDEGIIQKAVRALKKEVPGLLIITDVCFCEYTDHGHCGVLKNGTVDNDATLVNLTKQAVSHAQAGADMVAPSDMMDGRIGVIREALDEAGFQDIPIMAYSAKFASSFYGPFREAADSTPHEGDRKGYQMDPANGDEAIREAELDMMEGADILMVKPALSYLDIIFRVKNEFSMPVAAYNVSGEFSMVKAAAAKGMIDEEKVMMEMLTSMKRAGADIILTYFAKDAARVLGRRDK